ncbi:clavaminate synthase-like protein [Quercus suber]|uniref:Clavaminate synthase-like protein n=1 Tax=Quercus suber TaxID=58331 RepID=A0AAW0KGP8_QUESU
MESVAFPWQKGDALLLDNWAALHVQRSFDPPRRIQASLCKTKNRILIHTLLCQHGQLCKEKHNQEQNNDEARENDILSVDARPSDAINVANRCKGARRVEAGVGRLTSGGGMWRHGTSIYLGLGTYRVYN